MAYFLFPISYLVAPYDNLQRALHVKGDNRPKSFYSRQYVTSYHAIFRLRPLFMV
jgi:hypothetical protein